jgi:hypothetical protein
MCVSRILIWSRRLRLALPRFGRIGWTALAVLLNLVLVAFPMSLFGASAQRVPKLSEEQKQVSELLAIATRLRAAILARDIDTLLEYAPSQEEIGKYKSATYDARSDYRELLSDSKSWLYCQLFDTPCRLEHLRQYDQRNTNPYRIAIKDFFESHKELRVKVYFLPHTVKGGVPANGPHLAQVVYVVPGSPEDKRFPPPSKNWKTRLKPWGKTYVDTCLVETPFGWRYYSTPIFICPFIE